MPRLKFGGNKMIDVVGAIFQYSTHETDTIYNPHIH